MTFKLSQDQSDAVTGIVGTLSTAPDKHALAVLTGSAGTGKEQPVSTLVQTMYGQTTIGSLEAGNHILGADGKETKVTGVYPQGAKDVYEIGFRDGSSTKCGLEHIWSVKTSKGNWINKTTAMILKAGVTRRDASYRFQIPLCAPVDYPPRALIVEPYLLGLLIGDGALSRRTIALSSHAHDTFHYKNALTLLLPAGSSVGATRNTSENGKQTNIKGTALRTLLQDLKLNVKSGLRFIPDSYLLGTISQRTQLLQGLMDSDGSAMGNRISYSTVSTQLRDDIVKLVQSLGGTAIVRTSVRVGKGTEYSINVKVTFNPFRLPRKANEWRYSTKNPPSRYITSITKMDYQEESVCIKVAAKDSLYLTSQFIVTHNTTVVSQIMETFLDQHPTINILLGAATHRAATVLQDIVGQPVVTAHKLFKLKPTVSKTGKQDLENFGPVEIPHGSVVIIDEASMIGDNFLRAIVGIIKDNALKVLFVGDNYQLPPTNDTCSLFDGSLPTYTLTKVHRQKGDNPILDKAIEFREFIGGLRTELPILETWLNPEGEGIHVLKHEDFVSSFVKKYMSYDAGAEVDIPMCTFTNDSAINYNSMVRKSAYFLEDTVQPFYEGERLVSNAIVKTGDRVHLTNNEIVTVLSYYSDTFQEIPGHTVTVQGTYNSFTKTDKKRVFAPINKAAANKVLGELKKVAIANRSRADWAAFYDVKNSLADLRPPFAGTTHKQQGGTFPAVFIDQINMRKCRDTIMKARLLYVALTRATKEVYINS